MSTRLVTILAALCGLALVAGCGGGGRLSKSDYEKQVKQAAMPFTTASQSIGNSIGPNAKPADAAAPLQKLADAAGQTADKLDKLKPPKNVEAPHKRFVSALRAFKSDVEKLAATAKSGDAAQLKQQAQSFAALPSIQEANAASQEIKSKGYDIGGA